MAKWGLFCEVLGRMIKRCKICDKKLKPKAKYGICPFHYRSAWLFLKNHKINPTKDNINKYIDWKIKKIQINKLWK